MLLEWSNATKEDIEMFSGVIDPDKVARITKNTYVQRIEDMIELKVNRMEDEAREQIWHMMDDILLSSYPLIYDRLPEVEELRMGRQDPVRIEMVQHLLEISLAVDEENWPEYRKAMLNED